MKEDVKIIYCHDENGNAVHYSKTTKGNKYFCIDCGSELICKDGDIKVKLRFKVENLTITKNKLEKLFKVTKGIKYSFIIINKTISPDGYYEVIDCIDTLVHHYDKTLYAKLCNIA